jgi:hypothetical protein
MTDLINPSWLRRTLSAGLLRLTPTLTPWPVERADGPPPNMSKCPSLFRVLVDPIRTPER